MNCEKCQDLLGDFLDGSLSHEDQAKLDLHLEKCLGCVDVRKDLQAIVGFCREHRGEYSAPPNEKALWLRIRNMIEAGAGSEAAPVRKNSWPNWITRSWELSLPQLAAAATAIVLIVSLSTVVGLRRWQSGDARFKAAEADAGFKAAAASVRDRVSQQQQLISYWNQRVEFNKARWNPEMRETFDRNLKVIDQAVNESIDALTQNPHDEVSEEMLNAALREKLSLLKEFAAL